jgi:hypothetical protein
LGRVSYSKLLTLSEKIFLYTHSEAPPCGGDRDAINTILENKVEGFVSVIFVWTLENLVTE